MNKRKEIEIKLPLVNGDEVVGFLNKAAEFEYEDRQVDKYFNPPHRSFIDVEKIHEWLRLRNSGDKFSITYKNWAPKGFSCDEFEAKVSSFEDMELMLKALDFKDLVTVDKLRKVWRLNEFEISIDEVVDLGSYIEVEYKGDVEDVDAVVELLFGTLEKIGAKTGELDRRGYPWELLIKKGLIAA